MSRPVRNRSSCLTVPGDQPRMIEKARNLAPDELILDLEDSVTIDRKDAARANLIEALSQGTWRAPTLAVRINDLGTGLALRDVEQLVATVGRRIDAIVLPKVESEAHVTWLDLTLTQLEQAAGLEVGRIGIEAQIESPRALLGIDAIMKATSRLETVVLGPADLAAEMNVKRLESEFLPAELYSYVSVQILVAARARGVQAIDGPFPTIDDHDGLRRAVERASSWGYDGKWVIHPSQIDIVRSAFAPSEEDIASARAVTDALDGPDAQGAARVAGQMVDAATLRSARGVLAQAQKRES